MKERKAQRRGRGEGNVSLRQDGRWAAIAWDPVTGRRRWVYADTEAKARQQLRAMVARADGGHIVVDAHQTMRAYAEVWLRDRAGRRRRESTVRHYEWLLDHYVLPTLGNLRLREITVLDVEDVLDSLAHRGLGRWSVAGARNALAALMTDAIRARHLTINVARHARMPDIDTHRPVEPPTVEQVRALLDAAASSDGELSRLLTVLVGTGARIGEALGARWTDLDLHHGVWTISRTTTMTRTGSITIGNRTKSGANRRVALPVELLTVLAAQRGHVDQTRAACPSWTENDLVFPSSVGTAQDARNLRKRLRPIIERSGFPGSFHALRHFVASIATSTVPLPVVSKVLGHQRTATTSDLYAHLLHSDAGLVARAVTDALAHVVPDGPPPPSG